MVDAIARGLALSVKKNQPITTYDDKSKFPEIGNENMIYIDKADQTIYFWNDSEKTYVVLNTGSGGDPTPTIKKVIEESIIYGGDADDE